MIRRLKGQSNETDRGLPTSDCWTPAPAKQLFHTPVILFSKGVNVPTLFKYFTAANGMAK